jgi:general secretion pathway protein H
MRSAGNRGMTLVELLVVIAIIGVMAVGVGLTIGAVVDRGARDEATRLAAVLESFSVQARSSGRPLAWSHSGDRYRFWQRDTEGRWSAVAGDRDFGPRQLPASARISRVELDGQVLTADQKLVFSLTPPLFRITLGEGEATYRVRGSPSGRVQVESDGGPAAKVPSP